MTLRRSQECSDQEDCHHLFYLAHITSKVIGVNSYDDVKFFLSPPNNLQMHIYHLPKMQLIEYLCYMGSCLSLWFGVSFFSVALGAHEYAKLLLHYHYGSTSATEHNPPSSTNKPGNIKMDHIVVNISRSNNSTRGFRQKCNLFNTIA